MKPLLKAGSLNADLPGVPAVVCAPGTPGIGEVLVEARDVMFQHRDRLAPVIRRCTFRVRAGDKILLAGASGEGKSTLVSLIAGVRTPTSGLMLAGGLDRKSLGAQQWRRRVAAAPQFHENHLIMGPLAFNLLMARSGAITRADVAEAEEV